MLVERIYITQNIGFTVYTFGKGAPRVLITAGLHGDEVVGVATARILIDKLKNMSIRGTVRVIPVANELGLYIGSRTNPIDGKDLNRVFPGNANGSVSERLAAKIWSLVLESDYIIDLHGCGELCIPHILTVFSHEKSIDLAKLVPIEYVVGSQALRGQLFIEATYTDRHAVLIEIPGARFFRWSIAEDVAMRLLSFLASVGILKRQSIEIKQKVFKKYVSIVSDHEGLLRRYVEPGAEVEQGMNIVEVEGEKVAAPVSGVVIMITESKFVRIGDSIARIATEPLQ